MRFSLRTLLLFFIFTPIIAGFFGREWRNYSRKQRAVATLNSSGYGAGYSSSPREKKEFSWSRLSWTLPYKPQLNVLQGRGILFKADWNYRTFGKDHELKDPDWELEYTKFASYEGDESETEMPTADVWQGIKQLPSLEFLGLTGQVSDDDLKNLSGHRCLEWLDLTKCALTGEGLKHLNCSSTLKYLDLTGVDVHPAAFEIIADHFPNLEQLAVGFSDTSKEKRVYSREQALEYLRASKVLEPSKELTVLNKLQKLRMLFLTRGQARRKHFASLIGIGGITEFRLCELGLNRLHISEMPELEKIGGITSLGDTVHHDARVGVLEAIDLPSLREIAIGAPLVELRNLPVLEEVVFNRCQEIHLEQLPRLKRLCLINGTCAHQCILELPDETTLCTVDLTGDSSVCDETLEQLSRQHKVTELKLSHCTKITDDGLRNVDQLPLKKIDLSHTNISDQALIHIAAIASLREIVLTGTMVSEQAINELAINNPELEIRQ